MCIRDRWIAGSRTAKMCDCNGGGIYHYVAWKDVRFCGYPSCVFSYFM